MAAVLDEHRIRTLSLVDRFKLLTRIWRSILDEEQSIKQTSGKWVDEMKRRLAELKAHPERGTPWEEFEREMLAHLGPTKSSSTRQPKGKSGRRASTTKNGKKGSAGTSSRTSGRR